LGHISGHKGGVSGVYNKAAYLTEKASALALWAEHVLAVVEGRPAKIVSACGHDGLGIGTGGSGSVARTRRIE
jgi:hypothetical protein